MLSKSEVRHALKSLALRVLFALFCVSWRNNQNFLISSLGLENEKKKQENCNHLTVIVVELICVRESELEE